MQDFHSRSKNRRRRLSVKFSLLGLFVIVTFAVLALVVTIQGLRDQKSRRAEYESIQGTWIETEIHRRDSVVRGDDLAWPSVWEIRGNTIAVGAFKGHVSLHSEYSPPRISISPGPHGILKLERDLLMIHVTASGNPVPMNFETTDHSILYILKRVRSE